jgi:hypothetical protein
MLRLDSELQLEEKTRKPIIARRASSRRHKYNKT